MSPPNSVAIMNDRLELMPAFQGNGNSPLELYLEASVEHEGFRGGMSFSQSLIARQSSRSSVFVQGGYRYYLNSHHAFQLEAMLGGDVTGSSPSSTLYLLSPSYLWFPDSGLWGFNFFMRAGIEDFSSPNKQTGVFMGGVGFVWELPFQETDRPQVLSRHPDPERCREIQRLYYSTSSVTVIYVTEEAALEAEECLNQIRRNHP